MKLNHDCIRDIILFIEDTTTASIPYVLVINIQNHLNSIYDNETINYHVLFIGSAHLVEKVSVADNNIPLTVWDLTPLGHDYAGNIRDTKVWSKLKSVTSKLASISLPVLIEKSSEIAFNLLNHS